MEVEADYTSGARFKNLNASRFGLVETRTLRPRSRKNQCRENEEAEPRRRSRSRSREKRMQIARLDHLVLTVRHLDASVDFYVRVLGMSLQTFDKDRKALRFGRQKINLHESGKEFEPKAHHPTPGSADLCFVVETPLQEVVDHVRGQGGEIFLGPVQRTGAEGTMESVYLRDPDGNLIELSRYRTG